MIVLKNSAVIFKGSYQNHGTGGEIILVSATAYCIYLLKVLLELCQQYSQTQKIRSDISVLSEVNLKLAVEIEFICMNNKQLVCIITSYVSEHFISSPRSRLGIMKICKMQSLALSLLSHGKVGKLGDKTIKILKLNSETHYSEFSSGNLLFGIEHMINIIKVFLKMVELFAYIYA